MQYIWDMTSAGDFVIAVMERLCQKTGYGKELSVLTEAERVFYITQIVEQEVNNGGFSQFFFNSSGDLSCEIAGAFAAIGANKTAAICQKAVNAFGRELPTDREQREAMLNELETEAVDEVLAECDNAFFAYEENLNELNHRFVMENREFFS